MRKIIYLLIGLLIALTLFSFQLRAEESQSWKHSSLIPKFGKGEHYLLKLPQGSCAVLAYSDGNIEIFANDTNWHGIAVYQEIKIYPDDSRIDLVKGVERKYPHRNKRGYKVYVAKCKPHIDGLPQEVQQRLAGL